MFLLFDLQHQLIERAQANLAVVLDNKQDAQDLASILIKIASNCGSNLTLMRYAFTRIEEILGLGADSADADREVFGLKNAKYFIDNGVVMDGPFIKALNSNDQYLLKSASLGVAHLYAVCENGNIQGLIQWILSKITAVGENVWEIALPSLLVLVRGEAGRRLFIGTGGVGFVLQLLNRLGSTGSSQKIYDLCFILWTLTLSIQEENIQHFATGGLVTTLVTFLASAPSRKVARVCIFALKNLSSYGNSEIITEMLAANLEKVLGNVMQSALCKDSHDDELDNDVKFLNEVLVKNYRDLSTYDRWVSEVHSGALHWGIIHSDKFWKENARLLEQHDFDNLKRLIEILRNASDPVSLFEVKKIFYLCFYFFCSFVVIIYYYYLLLFINVYLFLDIDNDHD